VSLSQLKNKLRPIEPITFLAINFKKLIHSSCRHELRGIVSFVSHETSKSKLAVYWDMLVKCFSSCALYREYNSFQMYKRPLTKIRLFFTYGRAAYVIREMKSPQSEKIFNNKPIFNKVFAKFIKRDWIYITKEPSSQEFESFLQKHPVFVAKPPRENQGQGVWLVDSAQYPSKAALFVTLLQKGTTLLEERIYNHKDLDKFSSTSLNTIRIITLRLPDGIKIIRAFLKFNLSGAITDNSHELSFYCPLDFDTGEIIGNVVDQNTKEDYGEMHPSGFRALGQKIPYWDEAVNLAKECTLFLDDVYLGPFDIAITDEGPIIIEGNNVPSFGFQSSMNYPINPYMQLARKFALANKRSKNRNTD